jgi:hypothetical protein
MIFVTIILISIVVMFIMSRFPQTKERRGYTNETQITVYSFIFWGCLAPIILCSLMLFVSYWIHSNDLSVVRKGQLQIEVQKTRVNNLKNDLTMLIGADAKNILTALLNKDTPVKSIVDQLSIAEKDLATTSLWKNNAELDIEARKAGPFNIIVWLFGEK